ncbi:uncharacterized protein LOC112563975 [Pomacea canaliculata]|uniref:uncharacterized protein LOC112563975 n=1 Tax=Pomacea canaliculata TaxID=400727 RepID=UPI000D731D1E|nr:uncharacterized protein LOC112563975 [Pomacea canaliculata]XP_025094257.1 uncharacterized protein LOC112563975 [Pomacea canaliculata]
MAKLTKYRPNNSAILAKRGDGQVIYDNAAFQHDNGIQSDTNGTNPELASPVRAAEKDANDLKYDIIEITENEAGEVASPEDEMDCYSRAVLSVQNAVYGFFTNNAKMLWTLTYLLLLAAYTGYFITSMVYRFGDEGSIRLLVVTVLVAVYLVYRLACYVLQLQGASCDNLSQYLDMMWKCCNRIRFNIVLPATVSAGIVIFVIMDVARFRPQNLTSAGGIVFFIVFCYIFSHNPAKVRWRPVVWGLLLQFIFGALILRTAAGRDTFRYLGDRVSECLAYAGSGAKFVFGERYTDHFFAFSVLSVVVFFSSCVSMLYYLGFMQFLIRNLGRFLSFCLGTSPVESINAASNIFIGQSDAALMVKPFLANMTMSELHAILTGGFATIAGSVMAAYISYKVPADHLLSASVMSAPAALAMSKLLYPETEKVKNTAEEVYNMKRGLQRNIIQAASEGASQAVRLAANIAVNLIAFVALLELLNSTLTWLGDRVGIDNLTFQLMCSYLFWPLAFLMGVEAPDRRAFGELVGTRIVLNEFIAYTDLSKYIHNRATLDQYSLNFSKGLSTHPTGSWNYTNGGIYLNDVGVFLEKGVISERTVVVATYALCGFANIASMGLMLGALGSMAPSRRSDISSIVVRAMIAGSVACFLTACIAGMLLD